MEHIAIDLGGMQSQVCIRGNDETILKEELVLTREIGNYLSARKPARVVVETCAEAFAIADAAISHGHQARVVPATLVRSLGVGARGLKSDIRDARVLSEVSCRIDLPSVHIPSKSAREMKSRCGMRDSLIRSRTLLINNARGYLRAQAIRLRRGSPRTFADRVRESRCPALSDFVERQLVMIEALSEEIAVANLELSELARQDAICRRLMSVPGVGPITAIRFVAAVDDITRFENAHQLESYFGLVPGEKSSSERRRLTSITKAGSAKVRWTLIEASWIFWRTRPGDPLAEWATEVSHRRGRRIAVVGLARKLAGILYAIWRDGSQYDPKRGANPVAESSAERKYRIKRK